MLVGYGHQAPAVESGARLRTVNQIAEVDYGSYRVVHRELGSGVACPGDSGGPSYVSTASGERLVGVHTTAICQEWSVDLRTDANLGWLYHAAESDLELGAERLHDVTTPIIRRTDHATGAANPTMIFQVTDNVSVARFRVTVRERVLYDRWGAFSGNDHYVSAEGLAEHDLLEARAWDSAGNERRLEIGAEEDGHVPLPGIDARPPTIDHARMGDGPALESDGGSELHGPASGSGASSGCDVGDSADHRQARMALGLLVGCLLVVRRWLRTRPHIE